MDFLYLLVDDALATCAITHAFRSCGERVGVVCVTCPLQV